MSLDLVLRETTPKDESSPSVSQSNDSKQDLALTSNVTQSDANTSIQSITSNTSITSNDINTSNTSEDVSKEQNPQNCGTTDEKSMHREDMKKKKTRRRRRGRGHWNRDDNHYHRNKKLRLEYNKWSESREGETQLIHMKVVEHGQPLAPYNTTQFIMNEHNCDKEIDFDAIRGKLQRMRRPEDNNQSADPNDEDFYSSPEDESDYLQQQFHEAYDNIHAERLSSMNKNELVQEYLLLEDRVEDLERRLKEEKSSQTLKTVIRTTNHSEVQTEQSTEGHHSSTEADEHIKRGTDDFQQQIQRLSEENERLKSVNQRLERILSEHQITADTQM